MQNTSKNAFKRAHKCLSEICPFFKAAFTTQISRVRFNQELRRKRQRQLRHAFI
jgi:hypothetical protein